MKKTIGRIIFFGVILIYVMTVVYPIFLMVVTSLKPNQDIFKRPLGLPTSMYLEILRTFSPSRIMPYKGAVKG
jgi:ABC-type glycerol-3-phosphate transport system permease component